LSNITNIINNVKYTLQELAVNKLRTFLSLLSVSIGIFCISGVMAIVDSLEKNINDNLSSLGKDVIYIQKYAWAPEDGDKEYPMWKYQARPVAKQKEMQYILQNVGGIAYSSMLHSTTQTIKYNAVNSSAQVNAVSYNFIHVQPFDIANGRYFSQTEMINANYSVIIGEQLKTELFNNINPIGKQIKLFNTYFTIIGTVKKRGRDFSGFNLDEACLIPYQTMLSIKNIENPGSKDFADNTIIIQPKPNILVADLKFELKGAMRASRALAPITPDNFSLNMLSTIQGRINGIISILNIAGFCIGLLSLLVGAFGIANIMFVTVRERTKQIGLKKAIGAKRVTILTEFLLESILLCVIGGLVGMGIVFLLALVITYTLDFEILLSFKNIAISLSISMLIGIISGMLPANKASKMNAVDALRNN
jgi:putative ABC transport system permease protein